MIQERLQLLKKVQIQKRKGLTENMLVHMYKDAPDGLTRLMMLSDKSEREIKRSVGTGYRNWQITYKDCYRKLNPQQVKQLADCLELPLEFVKSIIQKDIDKQTK